MNATLAETFRFTLWLAGPLDADDPAIADALYEGECADALVGSRDGRAFVGFDRDAPDFDAAVAAATADVERAGLGLTVAAVEREPDPTPAERIRSYRHASDFTPFLITVEGGLEVLVDDPDAVALRDDMAVVLTAGRAVQWLDLSEVTKVQVAVVLGVPAVEGGVSR